MTEILRLTRRVPSGQFQHINAYYVEYSKLLLTLHVPPSSPSSLPSPPPTSSPCSLPHPLPHSPILKTQLTLRIRNVHNFQPDQTEAGFVFVVEFHCTREREML